MQEGCRWTPSGGPGLEAPGSGRLGSEDDVEGEETVTACHKQRDAIAWGVLLEALIETVGTHAYLINRDNLIIHVEAGTERRRVALHLRDDQAARVDLRRRADPCLRFAVRRSVGRPELQTEDLQGLAVVELIGTLDRRPPESAEVDAGDMLGEGAELVRRKAVRR